MCDCCNISRDVEQWLVDHFVEGHGANGLHEGGMAIDSLERSLMLAQSYEEFFQSAKEFQASISRLICLEKIVFAPKSARMFKQLKLCVYQLSIVLV